MMKKVTLEVDESKFDTLIEFLKTLDYVSVSESETFETEKENEIISRLNMIRSKTMKVRSWNDAKEDVFQS